MNIVVGFIRSPEGRAALDRAIVEARLRNARVVVVHSSKGGSHTDTEEILAYRAELEEIGVKRLSLGPGRMYAAMGLLRKIARELKEEGTYKTLLTDAITFDELNALAQPIAEKSQE